MEAPRIGTTREHAVFWTAVGIILTRNISTCLYDNARKSSESSDSLSSPQFTQSPIASLAVSPVFSRDLVALLLAPQHGGPT
jgi:hypothetical protein